MRRTLSTSAFLFAVIALAACESAAPDAASPPAPGSDPDRAAIAADIARNVAIQEGERVWIHGGSKDTEFMEMLAVAVAAHGGQPLVTLFSDATLRKWYRDVPERFDSLRDDWRWQMHETADVIISLPRINPATYAAIEPARLDAYDTANAGLWDLLLERDVRFVSVGNGMHPFEWTANMLGVELAELERLYWTGMSTDPARMRPLGDRLGELLRAATSVRIQHPNGTDLTVGVAGQRVVVSDGTLSPVRAARGAATSLNETWLPAGEVTLGVDPASAEGRLVLERFFLRGRDLGPATLTFTDGRLSTVEAASDYSAVHELTQSALPMSERLTGLKFGLNPAMTDARLHAFMGAGMVSPTMGSNIVLGGDVELPYGPIFLTLAGSTISVDGHIVVENGMLKL